MDEIDQKILNLLKENSRLFYVDIAKEVGLTEGAVRRRVKNLIERGIIKKFTIELGMEEKFKCIVMVSVKPQIPTSLVSSKIIQFPGVRWVYEISGEYDIICMICGEEMEKVNEIVEKIRRIKGVLKTVTFFVMK